MFSEHFCPIMRASRTFARPVSSGDRRSNPPGVSKPEKCGKTMLIKIYEMYCPPLHSSFKISTSCFLALLLACSCCATSLHLFPHVHSKKAPGDAPFLLLHSFNNTLLNSISRVDFRFSFYIYLFVFSTVFHHAPHFQGCGSRAPFLVCICNIFWDGRKVLT